MNRLQKLWASIEVLANLPDRSFKYSNFVYRSENKCGTVCCLAGWYPKYFPKAGLKWFKYESELGLKAEGSFIGSALKEYHELPYYLVHYLFFGSKVFVDRTPEGKKVWQQVIKMWGNYVNIQGGQIQPIGGITSSRKEVLHAAEFLYYLLENKYIYA